MKRISFLKVDLRFNFHTKIQSRFTIEQATIIWKDLKEKQVVICYSVIHKPLLL